MRVYCLILGLFLNFSFYSQTVNNGVITYRVSNIMDMTTVNKKIDSISILDEKTAKLMENMLQGTKDVYASLRFEGRKAIYEVGNSVDVSDEKESLTSIFEDDRKMNLTKILAGNNSVFYQNNNEKVRSSTHIQSNKVFLVIQKDLKWELTSETKKIGGYCCTKAILISDKYQDETKIIHAWFTNEIPFPYGPMNYHGLDGLILEVESFSVKFSAVKIDLNHDVFEEIKAPEGEKITKDEWIEMNIKFRDSLGK